MEITLQDILYGTAGGILIGLACALLWRFLGRIAGISGITANALNGQAWRLAFLAGLILGGTFLLAGTEAMPSSLPRMALAGFLIGLGSVLGSGCTSGHGVCGLSRLSMRSFVAVATFLLTGMLTVTILRLW
jgi:uncharacterized membrane protein YedE/YeeE